MFPAPKRCRGYTFAEILVVITVIGILVALLLPAVQACREAARRLNCSKNLEQLILAVHNYESLHQVFPPGTINATGPIQSLPQGYHHNWIIQVLPYLEQKIAYAHIDQTVGVYHSRNLPVRRMEIRTLSCPSSLRAPRAYSDYAGVHNDLEAPIDVTNNGVFFLNSRVRYFDLKDGSSNTLFIGEKETYAGDLGWMSGTRATLRNTGIRINTSLAKNWAGGRPYPIWPSGYPPGVRVDGFPMEAIPDAEVTLGMLFGEAAQRTANLSVWDSYDRREVVDDDADSAGAGMGGEGTFGDMFGGMAIAVDDYVDVGPEQEAAKALAVATFTANPALAVGGFGSQHPGGAQFAQGDGSVRFVSEAIDPITFLQLGHRDDGRLTRDSW